MGFPEGEILITGGRWARVRREGLRLGLIYYTNK